MLNYVQYNYLYVLLPSSIDAKNTFLKFLRKYLIDIGYSEKIHKPMGTPFIIDELLTNAMEHGNKGDPDKFIKIYMNFQKDKLIFYIEDEGEGFEYRNLPDPSTPINVFKESGRGLFFVKSYANRVHFNKKGNGVYILIENLP